MVGRFDRGCRRKAKSVLAVMAVGMLTACSSVPDAINPVEWYKGASDLVTGRERPAVARPAQTDKAIETTADQRKDLAKGLVADRGNAQYAAPVRREVAPTRPLARRTPAATAPQVAEAKAATPAVPPKPVVQADELPPPPAPVQVAQGAEPQPRVSPDRRTPTARGELGASAPPAAIDMQPPPRADVPETVPMPGKKGPKRLQQQYEQRLAESAQQVVRPDIVDVPGRSRLASEDAPIHLVPPSTGKRGRSGGGKGMAAPLPAPGPAASFQVASVDFASGAKLSSADRAAIAEVARLYKQTGGVVRVVGHAPAPVFGADAVGQLMGGLEASMDRANAVARELSRRGVPASKIMVGADPSVAAMGQGGAQVYLDVM